ncbi:uncharacterized protein ARMOST_18468 [Armillaria ostoyae]|uniref:Uncharacterized protein n=1 Tax=Armillaria ostoyae TaxID=47428 RepID=A0A284S1W4_ARMOS|nr:uncharacterized protein ARMOST_18468 [Armillaria ostoyae]
MIISLPRYPCPQHNRTDSVLATASATGRQPEANLKGPLWHRRPGDPLAPSKKTRSLPLRWRSSAFSDSGRLSGSKYINFDWLSAYLEKSDRGLTTLLSLELPDVELCIIPLLGTCMPARRAESRLDGMNTRAFRMLVFPRILEISLIQSYSYFHPERFEELRDT